MSAPPRRATRLGWEIAALLVLLIVAVHAAWDYWEGRRVQQRVQSVAATGAPVSLVQVERTARLAQADKDAAPYYLAAAVLASAGTSFSNVDPNTTRVKRAQRSPASTAEWYSTGIPPSDLDIMQMELNEKADALHLLDVATGLDFTGFPAGTDYSYRHMQFEQLANLSGLRTESAIARGDARAAVESIISELGLFGSRLRPVRVSFRSRLLVTAMRVSLLLTQSSLSAEDLGRLAAAFKIADEDDRLGAEISEFRAARISAFIGSAQYAYTAPGVVASLIARGTRNWSAFLERPYRARALSHQLDVYAELVAASTLDWRERLNRVREIAQARKWRDDGGQIAAGWNQPIGIASVPLSLSSVRAARTAIAIERFRLAHGGALPEALEELVPAFLAAVPIDPYTGEAVRYQRTRAGYLTYSVSFDRHDDGGDRVKDQPVFGVERETRQNNNP